MVSYICLSCLGTAMNKPWWEAKQPRMHLVQFLVTQSCPTLCNPMDCSLPGSSVHGDSPGKNTGVSCHALLQGIFLTQGLNPGLSHCRWILYHLSHEGSPWILEWVAYPSPRGSCQPRNWTGVFYFTGRFFNCWATREAQNTLKANPCPTFSLKSAKTPQKANNVGLL